MVAEPRVADCCVEAFRTWRILRDVVHLLATKIWAFRLSFAAVARAEGKALLRVPIQTCIRLVRAIRASMRPNRYGCEGRRPGRRGRARLK